jgi:anti-sigma factor RsiW
MNCVEVNRKLEAALDDALDRETKTALMLHTESCASCRDGWEEMRALKAILQSSAQPVPSASLDERVMRAFNQSHGPRTEPRARGWRTLLFGSINIPKPIFAAALILFAVALILAARIGSLSSTQISVAPLPPTLSNVNAPGPSPPQIVYVPVRVEPEVRKPASTRAPKRSLMPGRAPAGDAPGQRQAQPLESFTLVSAAGTNYTTNSTLKGFEPLPTATVRVIKGRGE